MVSDLEAVPPHVPSRAPAMSDAALAAEPDDVAPMYFLILGIVHEK